MKCRMMSPAAVDKVVVESAGLRDPTDELYKEAGRSRRDGAEPMREYASRIRAVALEHGSRLGFARALFVEATADYYDSFFPEAARKGEEALDIFRDIGDDGACGHALYIVASSVRWLGPIVNAIVLLDEALELSRSTNDIKLESAVLSQLSNSYRALGDLPRALTYADEAVERARTSGGTDEESVALLTLGTLFGKMARYDDAIEQLELAREIARKDGNVRLEIYAGGNLSTIYQDQGKMTAALETELATLKGKEGLNDVQGIAISLNNIGNYCRDLGEYERAFDALLRCLELSVRIGDREGESIALNNIGLVYAAIGETSRLIDCYVRSMQIAQEIGYRNGEAYSHCHLGDFYYSQGDLPKALMHQLYALKLYEETGDPFAEQNTVRLIGEIYATMGEYADAEERIRTALATATELGALRHVTEAYLALGYLHRLRRDYDEALKYMNQAERIALDVNDDGARGKALKDLADTAREAGDLALSAEYDTMRQSCARREFDREKRSRIRILIERFEGNHMRTEARMLGLDDDDQARVVAAMRVMSKQSSTRRALAASVYTDTVDNRAAREPALRILTFGPLRIHINGSELPRGSWKRKRARDLFKLLLVNYGRWLTLDEIHESLWGDDPSRNVEMLVMNAASHIRNAIEPDRDRRNGSMLRCSDGAYMLDFGSDATIDFLQFKELIVSARRAESAEGRASLYCRAVSLYGGDFLQEDIYHEWTSFERHLLKDAYLEGLDFLAREYIRVGRHDEAIELARRIVGCDNTCERGYEALLTGLLERGRIVEARRVLGECERAFREELELPVPDRLRELVERILRER